MIKFKESKNIYLYSENIDMRMGMNKIQTALLELKLIISSLTDKKE